MYNFFKSIAPVMMTAFFLVAVVGMMAFYVNRALSTPEAVFSHNTGQCVFIIVRGEYKHCDDMPDRYIKRWIK